MLGIGVASVIEMEIPSGRAPDGAPMVDIPNPAELSLAERHETFQVVVLE